MMFFPTTPNPRPADMNWSVVMYGFVTVVMLVFYFRRAKYIFDGPVTTVSSQWDAATVNERTVSAPAWGGGTESEVSQAGKDSLNCGDVRLQIVQRRSLWICGLRSMGGPVRRIFVE